MLRLRSDEQLVSLFRAGNDEAFRVIHDRYRARLLAYTRQMLGSSSADPEDAVQEIFVRAYSHLRRNSRELALRAWLYRIAHNRCIDDLRRPAAVATESMDELSDETSTDPHDRVVQRDALRRLIVDVQRLPEQQRSALLMREMGGVTYADVADALGVSVPAVKSLLVRARLGLAQASEARNTACVQIREDVITAHDRGVRASGISRRHLRDCAECRRFRHEMRSNSKQLAALIPALGPIAVAAKLLGFSVGGGAAGGTGAQGAAVGTSAAVGTGSAVGTGTAVGTGAAVGTGTAVGGGAATGGGILGGTAGLVGAGHVATVIAAAVVTAGGAIGIQQIAAPASPHHASPRVTAAASSHRDSNRSSTDSGRTSGPTATASGIPATTGLAISVTVGPKSAGSEALGPSEGAGASPSATAGRGHPHRGSRSLPINETRDPDQYLPPGAAATGSGSTTAPSSACTATTVSATCTGPGSSTCTVPGAGTVPDDGTVTDATNPSAATAVIPAGSSTATAEPGTTATCTATGTGAATGTSSTAGAGVSTGTSSTTGADPTTGTSSTTAADPTTGTSSTTGADPTTGTSSTTGTGAGAAAGTTTGPGATATTGNGSGSTVTTGGSTGSGSSVGSVATTGPKTTDPFAGTVKPGQGLSSTAGSHAAPPAGTGRTTSLKRGAGAAVYASR